MDEQNVDSHGGTFWIFMMSWEIKILMIKMWQKDIQEQKTCTVWNIMQSFQLEIQTEQRIT